MEPPILLFVSSKLFLFSRLDFFQQYALKFDPPTILMKNGKIFKKLILIAQKTRLDALKNSSKKPQLYKVRFLKKSRKTSKNYHSWRFWSKFMKFFDKGFTLVHLVLVRLVPHILPKLQPQFWPIQCLQFYLEPVL